MEEDVKRTERERVDVMPRDEIELLAKRVGVLGVERLVEKGFWGGAVGFWMRLRAGGSSPINHEFVRINTD